MTSDVKVKSFQFHPAEASSDGFEALLNAKLTESDIHSAEIITIMEDNVRGMMSYTVFYRPVEHIYYNAYLGSTGATTRTDGTANMNVDGSATPQEFYIDPEVDHDLHFSWLELVICDGTIQNSKFGALTALTNGIDLQIKQNGNSYVSLIDKAKTVSEIILETAMAYPFAQNDSNVNRLNDGGLTDSYFVCQIPIRDFIEGNSGLIFDAGTTDRIRVMVNDDLTGLTEFKVKVFGSRNPV